MMQEPLNHTPSESLSGVRDMELNPLTLAFTRSCRALEAPFLTDYYRKSLRPVRYCLAIGIFLYGIFGLLDAILLPERKHILWLVRYALICPALLSVILFSFSQRFEKLMQPALSLAMSIAGFGIILMIIMAPPPVNYSYYAGLILVFMVGYTFVKIRFMWATLAGWIIVALYELAAIYLNPTPLSVLINNNFFFISANIIGMFACYAIEYSARKDFFLARLFEQEKEKVHHANRELEKRVQERTAQLVKSNEDLKQEIEAHRQAEREKKMLESQLLQAQKMEAIGTLAGGIAHDFNNILSAILGYTEMALLEASDRSEISVKLEQVIRATQRAKELVNQILTFSRQKERERQPVPMNLLVVETSKLLRASLPSTISIVQEIRAKDSTIMGDPIQIHQVIMNLCTNAAHAMRETGGELHISLASLDLNSEEAAHYLNLQPGPYIQLEIKDTGHGIKKEVLGRVFEPFFTTKDPGEGTGMGLSVAHGIVISHGGTITVDSELGKGTSFKVILPRIDTVDYPELVEPQTSYPRGSERILLVDDEPTLVHIGRQMLEFIGYQVMGLTNPMEALKLFANDPQQFDLVISDMTMPKMTGEQLALEMLKIRSDLPIILCTGYSEKMSKEKAVRLGIRDYLMKPLTLGDLSRKIRQALTPP